MQKLDITAYYCPIWQRSHNEWDLVKNAKQYYERHQQPKIPLLGTYDDSLAETLDSEISLAKQYGIDGFIFDRYWKRGHQDRNVVLDNFVMKQDRDFLFSLMWCWKLSKADLPVIVGKPAKSEDDRRVQTDVSDFINMLDYCYNNYFNHTNYQKVDKRPYLVMYFVGGFLSKLGRDGFARLLDTGKNEMHRRYGVEPFFAGAVTGVTDVSQLPLDAVTGYNFLPNFSLKNDSDIIQDYRTLAEQRVKDRRHISNHANLDYIPTISAGWDATPRGSKVEKILKEYEFPWAPIIRNNTPENFEWRLNQGYQHVLERNIPQILQICARNERSEGAYIQPDIWEGYGKLEAIRRLKQRLGQMS